MKAPPEFASRREYTSLQLLLFLLRLFLLSGKIKVFTALSAAPCPQVHERIRQDERVVVMERTNVRHLSKLPEDVDIISLDLSFISVLKARLRLTARPVVLSVSVRAALVLCSRDRFSSSCVR